MNSHADMTLPILQGTRRPALGFCLPVVCELPGQVRSGTSAAEKTGSHPKNIKIEVLAGSVGLDFLVTNLVTKVLCLGAF